MLLSQLLLLLMVRMALLMAPVLGNQQAFGAVNARLFFICVTAVLASRIASQLRLSDEH